MHKLFISITALFLLILTLFFYKYFFFKVDDGPVIIYPDLSVTKIKPSESQESSAITESTIYDNLKAKKFSARKINLLPEPEQPINIAVHSNYKDELKKDEHVVDSLDLILAEIMNNKQNEVAISNDIILPEIIAEHEKKPNNTTIELPKKEEIEIIATEKEENYKNIKVIKVHENNKLYQNYATKKDNNHFKVQLASVKSEALGRLEGERIQKKHYKILGNLNITIQKIESEKKKIFHLVFAGPFADISRAKATCRKLASKGQTCIVAR